MRTTPTRWVLGAALLASSLMVLPAAAQTVVYDRVITTGAVANPNVGSFSNCLSAEGCMGNAGLVDTAGGNLPDTLAFTFTLTPAEMAAVLGGSGTAGTLGMVASRDIGHKAGDAAVDVIAVAGEGTALGSLFVNTIDSCPAGERGAAYSASLVCGANFHTDVTATDFVTLSGANVLAFAADGSMQFIFDPAASVGRLKIFSIELQITQTAPIPEPASAALLALGLLAVGFVARRRR